MLTLALPFVELAHQKVVPPDFSKHVNVNPHPSLCRTGASEGCPPPRTSPSTSMLTLAPPFVELAHQKVVPPDFSRHVNVNLRPSLVELAHQKVVPPDFSKHVNVNLRPSLVELAHQKVVPPDFSKHVKSQDIPEGSQLTLECHTTGIPCPSISWYMDDANIDASPEYIITKINGMCCLKVRKVLPEHAGRYTCKATNAGGEASSSARLTVISKLSSGNIVKLPGCVHCMAHYRACNVLGIYNCVSGRSCDSDSFTLMFMIFMN